METIDDETTAAAIDLSSAGRRRISRSSSGWIPSGYMSIRMSARPCEGPSGMPDNEYADGMIEHGGDVGQLLDALDELGITNNTIVLYTTDNGPHMNPWPDEAMTPFRSEKDTNCEGTFCVPASLELAAGDPSV
jgi:hypothetical protein